MILPGTARLHVTMTNPSIAIINSNEISNYKPLQPHQWRTSTNSAGTNPKEQTRLCQLPGPSHLSHPHYHHHHPHNSPQRQA